MNALDKNAVEKPNFTSLSGYASAKDISIAVMYAVFTKKIMLSLQIFSLPLYGLLFKNTMNKTNKYMMRAFSIVFYRIYNQYFIIDL